MCAHADCQVVCLAPSCANKRCHCHCQLLKNCNYKSHAIDAISSTATIPVDPLSFFSSQGFHPQTTSASTAPFASMSVLSPPHVAPAMFRSLDTRPHPCFSSEWGVQQG